MTKLQNTPGPWKVVQPIITNQIRIAGSMPGAPYVLEIATLTNLRDKSNPGLYYPMTLANARLMAASLELLEASLAALALLPVGACTEQDHAHQVLSDAIFSAIGQRL